MFIKSLDETECDHSNKKCIQQLYIDLLFQKEGVTLATNPPFQFELNILLQI